MRWECPGKQSKDDRRNQHLWMDKNSSIVQNLLRCNSTTKFIRNSLNIPLTNQTYSLKNHRTSTSDKVNKSPQHTFLTDLKANDENKEFVKKRRQTKRYEDQRSNQRHSYNFTSKYNADTYNMLQECSKIAEQFDYTTCNAESIQPLEQSSKNSDNTPEAVRRQCRASRLESIQNILNSCSSDDEVRDIIIKDKMQIWNRLHNKKLQSVTCARNQLCSLNAKHNERSMKQTPNKDDRTFCNKLGRIAAQFCRKENDEMSREKSIDYERKRAALVRYTRKERKLGGETRRKEKEAEKERKRMKAFNMRLELFHNLTQHSKSGFHGNLYFE